MSGLEVIGVLASASQLTDYCIKIISSLRDIYRLAHGKPNRYRRQSEQVHQLIETAQLVKATEALHIPTVENQLVSILVDAKGLQGILDGIVSESSRKSKKIYFKAVFNNHQEREVRRCFTALHEKKCTLTLSILSTYGGFLFEIRNGTAEELPKVRRKVDEIDKALKNFPDISSEMAKIQGQLSDVTENLASLQVSHRNVPVERSCEKGSNSGLQSTVRESQALINPETYSDASDEDIDCMQTPSPSTCSSIILPPEQNQQIEFPDEQPLTTYANVWSGDHAHQLNGNIGGTGSSVVIRKHYEGITARHNSRQINGDIIDLSFAMRFFQS